MKALRFRTVLTSTFVAAAVAATTVSVPHASAEPQLITQGAENVDRCTFEFEDQDKAAFQEIDHAILMAYTNAVKDIRQDFPQFADRFAQIDQEVALYKDSIRSLEGMKNAVSNFTSIHEDLRGQKDSNNTTYGYRDVELLLLLPGLSGDVEAAHFILNYQPVKIELPEKSITKSNIVKAENLRQAGPGSTYDVNKYYDPIIRGDKAHFNISAPLFRSTTDNVRLKAQRNWAPVNAAVDTAKSLYNNEDLRRLGQACEAHLQGVADENTPLKRLGVDKIISDAVDKFIAGAIGEDTLNDIIINALKTALGDKTADQAIADTVIKSMGGKTLDKVLSETVDQFLEGAIGEKKLHDIILDVTKEALGNRPIDEVLANTIVQSMGGKTLDQVINETIDQFMKGLIGEEKLNDIIQGAIREALGNQGLDDAISNTVIKSMGGKTLDKVLNETVDQFLNGVIGEEKLNDIIVNVMREALGNRPVDDVVAGMIIKSMGGKTLDKVAEDIIDKALTKLLGDKTLDQIGEDLIDHAIAETSSTPTAKMLSVFAGLFGALGLIASVLYIIPLLRNVL